MTDISLADLPGDEAAHKARKEAYDAEFAWHGETLHGLSSSRKDYWTGLCFKAGFPTLDHADEIYAFLPAAKALIYVCSQDFRRLIRLKATGVEELITEAARWVDEHIPISDEQAAFDLAIRILNASLKNRADRIDSGGDSKN